MLNPKSKHRKKAIDVVTFLNHFEFIAAGVNNGIVDEQLYKDWFLTPYVATWDQAEDFIKKFRSHVNAPKAFKQFETLAGKWRTEIPRDS